MEGISFNHGLNYPRPLFILLSPHGIKVEMPDGMAEGLEDRHLWEHHLSAVKLFVKLPLEEELIPTWPVFPDQPDDDMGFVGFRNLNTGAVINQHSEEFGGGPPLRLHVHWFDKMADDEGSE